MEQLVQNFFNIEVLIKVYPMLLKGVWMTLQLCVVVVPIGFLGGLLVAIGYSFHNRWLNALLIAYVDFFRAFPPLVLLIFVFFLFGIIHLLYKLIPINFAGWIRQVIRVYMSKMYPVSKY